MKRYVVALEGGDGAGKSTVARHLARLSKAFGVSYRCIGRSDTDAPEQIAALTRTLQSHGYKYSKETDMLIRIAREFQRAQEAGSIREGLVVMDRFVLSVFARSVADNIASLPVEQLLEQAASIAGLDATLFVECPFESAWARVQAVAATAGHTLSAKELRGVEYNRMFLAIHRRLFDTTGMVRTRMALDNSGSEDTLVKMTCEQLEPTLRELAKSMNVQ